MKLLGTFFLIFLLFSLLNGCNIINPEEETPSYIKVENVQLKLPNNEIVSGEGLTDIWLLVNNDFIGAFEIPFEVPVLASGNAKIELYPGVSIDGIKQNKSIYDFLNRVEYNQELKQGESVTFNPTYSFKEYITSPFLIDENFEDAVVVLKGTNNTKMRFTSHVDSSYSNQSGIFYSNADSNSFIQIESDFKTIPYDIPVFLEINYKSSVNFQVGVITTTNVYANDLILLGSSSWKKIYINLTQEINSNKIDNSFKIFFKGNINNSFDFIALDNVRLVY